MIPTSKPHFSKVHFNAALSSRLSKQPISPYITYVLLVSPSETSCPAHHNRLNCIILTTSEDVYKSHTSLLCNILNLLLNSSQLGPSSFLSTSFSNASILYFPVTYTCWYSIYIHIVFWKVERAINSLHTFLEYNVS
jgi:hypothetical protein